MTGPLEFVEAAHKQAEQVARAAEGDSVFDGTGIVVQRNRARGFPDRTAVLISPVATHIALHDPAAVLRRIGVERKLLAEHRATRTAGYDAYGAAVIDTCITCGSQYAPYPCATVRLLAEGWGWQEEQHG